MDTNDSQKTLKNDANQNSWKPAFNYYFDEEETLPERLEQIFKKVNQIKKKQG